MNEYWQYNGPHPRMLPVLLACDDPRTSWFFQLVSGLVFSSLGAMQKVERSEEATCCARVSNSLLQTCCTWATGDIIPLEAWGEELFLTSRVYRCVCSSYQTHNNYSSFTVWSPRRSELVAKFFLSGRLFYVQLWCVLPESANPVCFCYCQFCQFCQFCQHSFLLSAWVCIVCVPPRCFQLFKQRRFILAASIL